MNGMKMVTKDLLYIAYPLNPKKWNLSSLPNPELYTSESGMVLFVK